MSTLDFLVALFATEFMISLIFGLGLFRRLGPAVGFALIVAIFMTALTTLVAYFLAR
jgi:hypothetical protein